MLKVPAPRARHIPLRAGPVPRTGGVGRRLARAAHWATAAALLQALVTPLALALPDDREQPIQISADRAIRDEKRGVTIYTGNVQMRQGSMELEADSLTVFHEAADASRIVARGNPARMRQQPEPDEALVHARARIITYFRDEDRVHLETAARIERDDGSLVTGDSIDYFIARELVKAESDGGDGGSKVFVVIPPSLHQGQGDGSDDAAGTTPERAASGEIVPPPVERSGEDTGASQPNAAVPGEEGELTDEGPDGTTQGQ